MTYPPVTPRFPSWEMLAVALTTGDASVTFAAPGGRNIVTVISTGATFINFDAAAAGSVGATGFPLPANTPVTFYGPIKSVHCNSGTGTLVVYGA